MEEITKIEERYESRKKNKKKENPYFQYYVLSERELIYTKIVNKFWSHKQKELSILEIGAGVGDNLLFFHRLGIPWKNIYANELLSDRVEKLKMNLASESSILPGNALDLNYENTFDIVLQSTVFTSILDSDFKRELALKMMKMVKKRGIIIWYDFKYNNPDNLDVQGVGKSEIKRLFKEANKIKFHKVTLAPPIGRKVGKFYNLVNFLFPFLRTHLITIIEL